MDSQSIADHLRDEATARKNTTLGDLMDEAAELLDDREAQIRSLEASFFTIARLAAQRCGRVVRKPKLA